MNYISYYHSPLGKIMLTSDGEAITGVCFEKRTGFNDESDKNRIKRELPVFVEAKTWLETHFAGRNPGKIPLLRLDGTKFRKKARKILFTIPYGRTVTYGEIAAAVMKETGQKKMSAQAIGGAAGHNPVPVFCPCHRVVGAGGNLTGYAGGIDRKQALLALENIDMTAFFVPKKKHGISK